MAIQFGIFDHIESRGGKSAEEIYEDRIDLLLDVPVASKAKRDAHGKPLLLLKPREMNLAVAESLEFQIVMGN